MSSLNHLPRAKEGEQLALMIGAEGLLGVQQGFMSEALSAKLASMMEFDFGREFLGEVNKQKSKAQNLILQTAYEVLL